MTAVITDFELFRRAGLVPVLPGAPLPLPVMPDRVVAGLPGFPSPAADYVQDFLDLNDLLIWHKAATFFGVLGSGAWSMKDRGFEPSDMIIVDRSIAPRAGNVVMALVNNAHTMKELCFGTEDNPTIPWLKASNPEYDDIHFKPGDEFSIFGVVTFNVKQVWNGRR